MNFALDDRHRSLRRFVMNALGSPPWTVRTERQPVADEERPVAVVEAPTPATTTRWRTSVPQGDIERQQAFAVMLYPPLGATAAESRLEASQLAELLMNAIDIGLVDDEGELLSAPRMLPVYDFEDVPVKGPQRGGPADAYGWLRADDCSVGTVQDPDDPLRWTVTCTLRVSWEQAGRERPPAPVATAMPGTPVMQGPAG